MAGDLAAAIHQQQGWDTCDAETRRQLWGFFRIDLEQSNPRLQLLRRALEHRRHRAAWTAPGRPDVDQNGDIIVGDVPPETFLVDLDRMACEDRLVASATTRAHCRALDGQAVETSAMPTDDVTCFAHMSG